MKEQNKIKLLKKSKSELNGMRKTKNGSFRLLILSEY